MNIVEEHLNQIVSLCNRHKVMRMYLFGSVLTGNSRQDSDVDFLVTFEDVAPGDYFDNYTDLKIKLEYVLGKPVDLVEEQTIKNPVLRRSIDRNKKIIYGRAS